jgi:hypothetical protein
MTLQKIQCSSFPSAFDVLIMQKFTMYAVIFHTFAFHDVVENDGEIQCSKIHYSEPRSHCAGLVLYFHR